jgi:hypothetical protein
MPATSKITIAVEELEKELLKKYAEKTGLTMSGLIRRAMREYLIKRGIIKEGSKLFLIVR